MSVNANNVHIGRGDIYLDVTVPAEGSVVPLTNGIPGSGTHIGATTEGANFIYRPTHLDLMIEQSTLPLDSRITTEEVRLEFGVAEMVYDVLKRVMSGAKDKSTFVAFGGITAPPKRSVLLVSPKRDGNYIEAMIYTAVFSEDRNFPFQRAAWSSVRVVARSLATTTRSDGDQCGFIHTNVVSG